MIEKGKGLLIHWLIGRRIKDLGLERFRELLAKATLKPKILKKYIETLAVFDASEEGLVNSFKAEYVLATETIDDTAAGKIKFKGTDTRALLELMADLTDLPVTYYFDAKKTKKRYINIIRTYIANAKVHYSEITPNEKLEMPERPKKLKPNPFGEIVLALLIPSGQMAVEMKCGDKINIGATQLLIALKCYKIDNGDLPDSLDELVPQYIDKIPIDDFDGKPLRYSKQKKIIYSVGSDLEDSGGPEPEEWEKLKKENDRPGRSLYKSNDPAFKIDF